MRRLPSSWDVLASKLGFTKKVKVSRSKSQRKLRFEQCEDRHMLTVFTVNDAGDFVDTNPNVTTLREAIDEANAADDHDTILFNLPIDPNTGLKYDKIILTQGELTITDAVTIDAEGQAITIDASGNDSTPTVNDGNGSRVFDILLPTFVSGPPREVTLADLTITGGDVPKISANAPQFGIYALAV